MTVGSCWMRPPDAVVATTTTNASGVYLPGQHVPDGSYQVQVTAPLNPMKLPAAVSGSSNVFGLDWDAAVEQSDPYKGVSPTNHDFGGDASGEPGCGACSRSRA